MMPVRPRVAVVMAALALGCGAPEEAPEPVRTSVGTAVATSPRARPDSAPVDPRRADARAARFRSEVRAFAADVEAAGAERARARAIAYTAVAESYRHGVPPALVFAIMRIENTSFSSTARSSAGARGLMQVMPTVWSASLGPLYGYDPTDDATNLGWGVHILAHYYARTRDWRQALLRYNGCVLGTNTPNCHRYPDWVRMAMERQASHLCPTGSFEQCVTRRLYFEFDPAGLHTDG